MTALAAARPFEDAKPSLEFLEGQFAAMAGAVDAGQDPAAALIETLNRIASSALIDLVFGLAPDHPDHIKMLEVYHRLGPDRVIFQIGPVQQACFADLRKILDRLIADDLLAQSVAGHARISGRLDETLAGNLIYMVEGGRHDIASLLRWVLRDLAYDPASQTALAQEDARGDPARPLAVAFVKESLRMNQIERLTRLAKQDIVFETWLIPKGSFIRLCLWEAHKDPEVFERPFEHCPGRFLDWNPGRNAFAPFGIDKHNCPFENATLRFCTLVLGAILRHWRLGPVNDGPAVRNYYQWAPPPAFTVALSPKLG
ncbi:cytochrome P450 [Palleronia sp. KMU-117]|uniref:cytochrome P450 n=1 Tax=Palleronia sp. KMU-117 TaxID=3434108 RepID=UPI003D70E73A